LSYLNQGETTVTAKTKIKVKTKPKIPHNPQVQQQGSLGSSIPMEYGYAVSAVIVAIAAATGYLYLKRKKHPKQSPPS
jgi:hypothetical protein